MTLISSDLVLPLSSQIHSHLLLLDSRGLRWAAKTPKTFEIFSVCAPYQSQLVHFIIPPSTERAIPGRGVAVFQRKIM